MRFIKFVLFNKFTTAILKFDFGGSENGVPDRVKAFLIEGLYTFAVVLPFIIFTAISTRMLQQILDGQVDTYTINLLNLLILIPLYGLCILTLNKDFLNGQSIVNRLWGYQVVDNITGQTPNRLKCMLRNLTAPILPIELFVVLVNQERRLGDFIAGTKLVRVGKSDPELILNEIESADMGQKSGLALTISTLLFTLWAILSYSN